MSTNNPLYWGEVLTREKKDKIMQTITNKLEKSFEHNEISPDGAPLWLNIIYILDLFNLGNFYGKLSMRVKGNHTDNIRLEDQSKMLQEIYSKLMDEVNS